MSDKHLKSEQHYSDLYDRYTVDHCRRVEEIDSKIDLPEYKGKEIPKEEAVRMKAAFSRLHMYFVTGEEYIRKSKAIRQWMERDKKYDELYEQAKAPENITCLTCGRLMFVTSKHLDFAHSEGRERVMFFYDCALKHKPMRVFYNDGEEYRVEPHVCPKCNSGFDEKVHEEKDKMTVTYTCLKCGYLENSEIDLKPKEEKSDPDFVKDRNRFCLSEKDGQAYIEGKARMEGLGRLMDSWKEKEKDKDLYDKVAKLKKLKIIEVEKLLTPILEKMNYIKLQFQTPQVGKDFFVPFIVYDAKDERFEHDSINSLRKILKQTLEGTNWRLMSEGIRYRLGMLEGRLRAYEKEGDLLELVKKIEKH